MEEVIDADYVFVMDDGRVVMQGTPREIFSQVETLLSYGLDVPQITRLAWELKKESLPIPDGILSRQELVEAICQLKSKILSYTYAPGSAYEIHALKNSESGNRRRTVCRNHRSYRLWKIYIDPAVGWTDQGR